MIKLSRIFSNSKQSRRSRSRGGRNPRVERLEGRELLSTTLNITVENLSPAGGLYQTPFWVGVHNGRFDVASLRRPVSDFPGLESLAEDGDTSELSEYFQSTNSGVDATILAPGGFPAAPVLDPGEVVEHEFPVPNPRQHRFLSFASMVIPSNDAFLANLNPRGYRLFDHRGNFRGPLTIELFGRHIWDAGSEVNNPQGGAAFSTEGGIPVDEGGLIHRHQGLENFVGTGLPTGESLGSGFDPSSPIARISVALAPVELQVTVENLSPQGGLFQTPFWVGVHDGRFDVGSVGDPVTDFPGLELLAEDGDTSEFSQYFQETSSGVDTTILAPGGFSGAPVFDPGEEAIQLLEVPHPHENRYFSFASMVIPSNDAFLGNLNSRGYRLFDQRGNFRGPVTIPLYGRNVWDSGSELNDPQAGAAFSSEGGIAQDENGVIHRHQGLDDFVGTGIPTGEDLQTAFRASTPLARITVQRAPIELQVTVENLSPDGGVYQTPFWVGFHNGRFDVASLDDSASSFPGLELLAEEGDTSQISQHFQGKGAGIDTTIAAPGGFPGAPVFDPGEQASQVIEVSNPHTNRFFSFASMVIPSNDAFLGNLNPRAHRLFDRNGSFRGPVTINLYGRDVWDAATEVNDPLGGAAFSTEGGNGETEHGNIHRHNGLDDFVGSGLPTGDTLRSAFIAQTPLARITISRRSDPSGPVDRRGPEATLQSEQVQDEGDGFHEFQVVYADPSGVDVSSIDGTDLIVVALDSSRRLRFLRPRSVTTRFEPAANPRTVIASYQVRDVGDRYWAILVSKRVSDALGFGNARRFLGGFDIV